MQPKEILTEKLPVPAAIHLLHQAFQLHGKKLYVVGGAVRDFYQKQPIKDYDLVTEALPDQVVQILQQHFLPQGKISQVGKSFGVVLITFPNGEHFEIATFRKDAKTGDGRRPDYVTFSTLEEDAERRDLTINALYYSLDEEQILDFHGGLADLRHHQVRFVGKPEERLEEDLLRALRFVRFHSRLTASGPASIPPDILWAIKGITLHPCISPERIRDEFLKGLTSAIDPQSFLLNLEALGLLKQVFRGLLTRSDLFYQGLIEATNPIMVIAQILRNNDNFTVKEMLVKELKYPLQEAVDISFLLSLGTYMPEDIIRFKKAFARTSFTVKDLQDFAHKTLLLHNSKSLLAQFLAFPYPTVKSQDLLAAGFVGKALGQEIQRQEIANFLRMMAAD